MSFGTFQEISRAKIRLQQVKALGLEAKLAVRYTTEETYWLEFRDSDAVAPVLDEVTGANPDLQLQTLACL